MGRAEVEDDREVGRPVHDHDGEERHELSLVLFSHSVSELQVISCDFARNLFQTALQVCAQDFLRLDRSRECGLVCRCEGPTTIPVELLAESISMKHLLKIKRKKSPEPPQQPISGRPADNAAGPPTFHAELDGVLNRRQSFPSGSGGKLFRSDDFTRRGRRDGSTEYVSRRNGCGSESPRIGSFDVWLCDC